MGDGEPAWAAELRRIEDERLRTELAVIADHAFWSATLSLRPGEPSAKAMRHALDCIIDCLTPQVQPAKEGA